jgi:hypothetical protein
MALLPPEDGKVPRDGAPRREATISLSPAPAWRREVEGNQGTFKMSWLRITLTSRTISRERMLTPELSIRDWKKPVSQTLRMRTNMEAKKINMYQST